MTAKLYIYRNLHMKDGFSIRYKGKVIARHDAFIARGVQFKVNENGRRRVIAERRKNVHAFVVAEYFENANVDVTNLQKVYYNPYKAGTFLINGEPVTSSKAVVFKNGSCYLYDEQLSKNI